MKGKIATVANGITFFRLGLLVIFVVTIIQEQRVAALTLFGLAWGLDVVDGWVARARGEASELGSVVDKISDRLILATGLFMFLLYNYVSWYAVLLATKDALLVPLILWRRGRWWERDWSVGAGGKLVSVLQGGGLVWLVLGLPGPQVVVGAAVVMGVAVALQALRGERLEGRH